MKLIYMLTLGVLTMVQTACENARNASIDNLVYFSEASSSKTKTVSLEDEGTSTSLTVRLAKAIGSDINVTIGIDETYLDDYNGTHETDYKLPDTDKFSFTKTATIQAGDISSLPIDIHIDAFDTYGVQYAIPLSITSVEGEVQQAEASSRIIIFLVKPLKQLVPKFTWYNAMQALPSEEWRIEAPNYTLEWWSRITARSGTGGYTVNNQAIFNSGGMDANGTSIELYIRFGDLVYAEGSSYKYNFLQVKTLGSQFDSGDPTAGAGLEGGTWYHFAVTYEAATGTTLLYKNGEQIASLSTTSGQSMWIDKLQMISSGSAYFPDYCEMCQVRLWKTTRTPNQIKNNMYSEVDPTNSDLILYLPMNEGEGSTLYDTTGNGHNVEIGNLSTDSRAQDVTWESYTFAQ